MQLPKRGMEMARAMSTALAIGIPLPIAASMVGVFGLMTPAVAAGAATTAAKLPPEVAREMADAVLAVDKALGLESWAAHGDKPCIDRGGLGATTKDVGAEETRACAATGVAKGFATLGKSYVLAILMADIGPVTVVAVGTGDASGWGAYSCDPGRKCPPTKLDASKKWGKRLIDYRAKACAQPSTIWFPAGQRDCDGTAPAPSAPATAPSTAAPAPAK